MRLGRILSRAFFERPCLEVAADLVGAQLVRRLPHGSRLVGRLVEVEAYLGDGTDPGSHSHNGETPRNRSMFGPAGRLYAYRSYGIHTCLNVVCEPAGSGAAVLLRALEPLEGITAMRRHRGLDQAKSDREIARGPGRLAQAFQIGLGEDGASLLRGAISLRAALGGDESLTAQSRRIGLSKGTELRYRFFEADSPWVSRLPPSKSSKPNRSGRSNGSKKPNRPSQPNKSTR